jgi:3D (Asp-Asp-Asp) domain-containing protein
MRSLFIAVVFSVLALGCAENQFVPANEVAKLDSKTESQSDFFTLAEDGEYEIITAESLSSGGKQATVEAEKKASKSNHLPIPREALEDPDFGAPKTGNAQDEKIGGAHTEDADDADESDWHDLPAAPVPTFPVPKENGDNDDLDLPTLDVPKDADIALSSHLRPTVYYFPVINEDVRKCERDYILRDEEGEKILSLCEKTRASCRLQGSCAIIQGGKTRTFNIMGNVDGKDRFFETSKDECRFGFGVKSSCLDPFYTVAADLSVYRPGDVIYVPLVRGVELPDGSKHSGYFLVRDSGRNILGKTRFDFFTGHISWRDDENPFSKIGLASKTNRFQFMKIKGAKAKAFSLQRSYPKLPVDIVKH